MPDQEKPGAEFARIMAKREQVMDDVRAGRITQEEAAHRLRITQQAISQRLKKERER